MDVWFTLWNVSRRPYVFINPRSMLSTEDLCVIYLNKLYCTMSFLCSRCRCTILGEGMHGWSKKLIGDKTKTFLKSTPSPPHHFWSIYGKRLSSAHSRLGFKPSKISTSNTPSRWSRRTFGTHEYLLESLLNLLSDGLVPTSKFLLSCQESAKQATYLIQSKSDLSVGLIIVLWTKPKG